jgi:hypothetical protein
MSTGADALAGKKEYITGLHTFDVTTQTKVFGSGMMVSLFPKGKREAAKTHSHTAEEGWDVAKGDRVKVYNAEVWFT